VLTTARKEQVTWDCSGLHWIALHCIRLHWIALGGHWGPLMATLIACRHTRVQLLPLMTTAIACREACVHMLGSVAMQQALELEVASGSEAGEGLRLVASDCV
jgi:hypothetical protein